MSAHEILVNTLGGKCEECGTTENLHLHHKDHNRQNNELSNIQLLCQHCHMKTNRKINKGIKTSFMVDAKLWRRFKACCAIMDKSVSETLEVLIENAVKEFERAGR